MLYAFYERWQGKETNELKSKLLKTKGSDMIEYKYKKVTGYEQKKFIENGHTMFEDDVLQRLQRLAYLEDKLEQANEPKTNTDSVEVSCGTCADNIEAQCFPNPPCIDFSEWKKFN